MSKSYDTNYHEWPYNWTCKFCEVSGDTSGKHFFGRRKTATGQEFAHTTCWEEDDKKRDACRDNAYKEAIADIPRALRSLGSNSNITVKDLNRAAAFVAASVSEWCFPVDGIRPSYDALLNRADAFTAACDAWDARKKK